MPMSPIKAVRQFCVRCAGSAAEVPNCGGDNMLGQGDENGYCFLYDHRMGRGRVSVKTIRKICLECKGGSRKLVRECPAFACPLHPFRLGTNPNRARKAKKIPVEEGV